MSVQAMSWVLEKSRSKLGSRLVLLSIANHADRDGRNAYPSIATIARESHMSERQAQRAVRVLVLIGELATEANSGPHGTNTYVITGMSEPQESLGGGDKLSPCDGGGVTNRAQLGTVGVTNLTGGVTNRTNFRPEMSPEPSFEPSFEPSLRKEEGEYPFVGKMLRLNRADYDGWKTRYAKIVNFDIELHKADDYYRDHPIKDGKYFYAFSRWMAKANEDPQPERKRVNLTIGSPEALAEDIRCGTTNSGIMYDYNLPMPERLEAYEKLKKQAAEKLKKARANGGGK